MFIHIKPEETQTIRRIPRALLFPAPGAPKGHLLMGYNDKGHCPMLVDDKCSIYEHRPQTCRTYDCRIFAATGIAVEQSQAEIAERASTWLFHYEGDQSYEEQALLKKAAAFLRDNNDLFAKGSLPTHPAKLAVLAVRIYRLFADSPAAMPDAAIAQAISALLH
jgi:Fe-S-cluster containining protein